MGNGISNAGKVERCGFEISVSCWHLEEAAAVNELGSVPCEMHGATLCTHPTEVTDA
jgi:hypothetical protein